MSANNIVKQDLSSYTRTPEEIDDLLVLVRQGDHAAIQEMILAHWWLVELVAVAYGATYGANYLHDDMISEGLLAVTQKVNEIALDRALQDHDNITAFLRVCIYRCIGDWVLEQQYVGSSRTHRNQAAAGQDSIGVSNIPCPEGAYFEADPSMTDLRDFLESIPNTEEERSILQLSEEGHSPDDIATILGLPRTAVYLLVRDIHRRFLAATQRLCEQ